MRFLARLFAPSETELLRRQEQLEKQLTELRYEWDHELLHLTRLRGDLTRQLKSLGAYEARARRADKGGKRDENGDLLEWPDLEEAEGVEGLSHDSSFAAAPRRSRNGH